MFKKISPVVLVGLVLTGVSLYLYISGPAFIQAISSYAYDTFVRSVHDQPKSGRVAIVDLDEESLKRPELGQWPWPRYLVSEMTRKILDAGASVVAFDIVFAERDRTSPIIVRTNMNRHFNLDVEIKGVPDDLFDFDEMFATTLASGKTILGCAMIPCEEVAPNADPSVDPYFEKEMRMIVKGKGDGKKLMLQSNNIAISIKQLLKASRS